jgi:hypothetical protein
MAHDFPGTGRYTERGYTILLRERPAEKKARTPGVDQGLAVLGGTTNLMLSR